jgi:putative transcriptional regulator
MDDKLFEELLQSVREVGAIERGEIAPARETRYEKIDVCQIRAKFHLSQGDFARVLGISVRTLQNWEQGTRNPVGATRKLLEMADADPEAFLVHPAQIPQKAPRKLSI